MRLNHTQDHWSDWQWQHGHSCKDLKTLTEWMELSKDELKFTRSEFDELTSNYRMGVTPYYFNLIQDFNENDPIFRQIIPSSQELKVNAEELLDPISDNDPDRGSRPLKSLIHRYRNRVLLLPTAQCAVYCRFCFRKRLVGDSAHNAHQEDLEAAYTYIELNKEIEEVILTGGDPLTLGDRALEQILNRLAKIKHVRLIRIHTRLPVVNPFRLTPELGGIISGLNKPVWISAHFNHPREVTDIARAQINTWINLGIPFLNQSVLLRGVNDSAKVLGELFMDLISIKVKPYYLHQTDLVMGTSHLRVSVEKGLSILRELQGELPGYALPHYVLDRPGGSGKVPLQNQY